MLNYTMKNLTSIQGSGGKLELISSNLHMNGGVIYNASAIVGAGLTNDLLISGSITLNGDINMANFTLNNVRNVNKSDINLSLIPANAGLPGQVLTRASNFDIKDPLTAQLVWTTPSGGGVTNPLSGILDCNGFGLFNVGSISSQNGGAYNISLNGNILSTAGNSISGITNITGYGAGNALNLTGAINIVNSLTTPNISTASNLLITTPTLSINYPSNPTVCDMRINGNMFFYNNQATLGGLGGLVISASQINNSGNNISMNAALTTTGNITLAATKRLNAPSVYTNNIRPYANSELVITGLQTDNKTLSNITISAPVITINNQFDALNPGTIVNIDGTLSTNTITTLSGTDISINGNLSFVQNIPVLSSPNGLRIRVAEIYNTGLVTSFLGDCVFSNVVLFASGIETNTLKQRTGTALALTSPTINISGSTAINLTGQTNFDKNINLLSNRGANINPSMVLYRTYGEPSITTDIRSGTTYVKVTDGQTAKGSKVIPANGLIIGDLYKFELAGIISCDAKVDMTFSLFAGTSRLCTFTCGGDVLLNQGFRFTTTLCVQSAGVNQITMYRGIGIYDKDGKSPGIAIAASNLGVSTTIAQTFDLYMKPVSTLTSGSVTIYNFSIENI
jgi:hypothetical protein